MESSPEMVSDDVVPYGFKSGDSVIFKVGSRKLFGKVLYGRDVPIGYCHVRTKLGKIHLVLSSELFRK